MVKDLLFELFGEGELEPFYDNHFLYTNDIFRIEVLMNNDSNLVSVDFKSCFNKVSQCPIHFIHQEYKKFSRRKKNRIRQALRYLQSNKKIAGTYFGKLDYFDDLSVDVLNDFNINY